MILLSADRLLCDRRRAPRSPRLALDCLELAQRRPQLAQTTQQLIPNCQQHSGMLEGVREARGLPCPKCAGRTRA